MSKVVYFIRNIKNNNNANNEDNGENKGTDKFFQNIPVNCFEKHESKGSLF